jgi:predicted nucleic acid-binding protein
LLRVRAVQRQNDEHLLRFSRGEECLWFFYSYLFSATTTVVIFCHNGCLRRIYLILIAKADLLDLFLTSVNAPIAIPGEVEKECCGSKKPLDAIIIQKALDESRIEVFTLRNRRLVAKLQTDFSLSKGEAEAIALALDEKAQIVGIDDKNGIDACKSVGHCVHDGCGYSDSKPREGIAGRARCHCQTCAASKARALQTFNSRDARLKLEAKP